MREHIVLIMKDADCFISRID